MKHLLSYESKLKTIKYSELGDSWSVDKILNKEKKEAVSFVLNLK